MRSNRQPSPRGKRGWRMARHSLNRQQHLQIGRRDMADEMDPANNQPPGYVPPKVWTWDAPSGGQFANINRPISGATSEKALPVGRHKLQLYSMGTPNGVKVTIMLEELLAAGHADAEYDAWLIKIGE